MYESIMPIVPLASGIQYFLEGDMDVVTLLAIFIIGILTRRFVPWWVHEEALEKLKKYEEAAPELITITRQLLEELQQKENDFPIGDAITKETKGGGQ